MSGKLRILLVCTILVVFYLIQKNVTAVEVSLIKNRDNTNYSLILSDVTGNGVGGFYAEILLNPPCSLSDINVTSDTFLVAYNVVNSNSVLKIAGAQGNIPGPTGDVILFQIFLRKNINLSLVSIKVSDVDGNTIISQTYISQSVASTSSIPTYNSPASFTPTITQNPVQKTQPNQNSELSKSINHHSTETITPTFAPYTPSLSPVPLTDISNKSQQEQDLKNSDNAPMNVTKSSNSENEAKKVPGFSYLISLVILAVIALQKYSKKKKKKINRKKL